MTRHGIAWRAGLSLAALLLVSSCASVRTGEKIEDYRDDVSRLENILQINPQNAEALRDLGVIAFRTGQYPRAKDLLKRAIALNIRDAKTLFHYGMALEQENDTQGALAAYITYTDYSVFSAYRRLLEGRYHALTKELIRAQFKTLITQELQLTDADAAPNTVAVFPLLYSGGPAKYAALGKGLSELFITDLGQVASLRLVERIRVQELVDELQLSNSALIDTATAPRLGRLMKAGQIVAGSFNVSPDDVLLLNVQSGSVQRGKPGASFARKDDLSKLFRLQKDAVFDLLGRLGIDITPAERDRIARNPTANVQAFTLYSIGLEKEDVRDFLGARAYYQEAVALDKNFQLAAKRAEMMDALIQAGTKEKAMASSREIESRSGRFPVDALVTTRMMTLMSNAGVYPLSGSDERAAPSDAYRAPAPILTLREPPPPPIR